MTDVREVNYENTINAAERVRLAICNAPVVFEGTEIPVTASFGIARVDTSKGISESIKYADEALYKAKETGRNKVVFYETT